MYWQKWSDRLKRELKLGMDPVAVAFGDALAPGIPAPQAKLSVCQALKRAAEGESVTITAETCGCPGGLVSLGLGRLPLEGRERLVHFLVEKEKVYCSRVAIHRSQQTVPPPVGIASRVSFSPLSTAAVLPDIVVFIGKPGSLHQLVSLAGYWEGGSIKPELSGPACRTGVAYPVVTGGIGLSLLDFGARRLARFSEDHLLVSIPLHRMAGILDALDQGVGRAGAEEGESIERQIEGLGKVE
ncbi:MAG: DUF169 domain-containing protein [Candidatus Solibacter sp.]|jgi:uncharacterized protein (DUF169 family)